MVLFPLSGRANRIKDRVSPGQKKTRSTFLKGSPLALKRRCELSHRVLQSSTARQEITLFDNGPSLDKADVSLCDRRCLAEASKIRTSTSGPLPSSKGTLQRAAAARAAVPATAAATHKVRRRPRRAAAAAEDRVKAPSNRRRPRRRPRAARRSDDHGITMNNARDFARRTLYAQSVDH